MGRTSSNRTVSPRFHLLTLSDGGSHPEAAFAFIEGQVLDTEPIMHGPYIITPGVGGLHALWNWKTGTMLTVRSYPLPT